MRKITLIILIILTSSRAVYSQSHPFKQFKSSDGLPSPNIYDCIQDREGFMWFATDNGLSRFDSHSFKNFYKEDGLNSLTIMNIVEKEKEFYISNLNNGINIYKEGAITNINNNEKAGMPIDKIVIHKSNIYMFAYNYISMLSVDSSIFIWNPALHSFVKIPLFSIYRLHSVNDERLLAATSDGLYEVKNEQFIKLNINGLYNSSLYYVTSDKKNNIYVSSDNAIYKISGDAVIETYKFNFIRENKIFRIIVDHNNFIWFSVMNKGLFKFNPVNNHLTDLNKKLDAEKLHVNSIFEDQNNNVWVCTFGKGVYCFYNTFINNYNTKDGLSHAYINSISGDSSQRIYCGTYNGLSILEQDQFDIINSKGPEEYTDYIRFINKVNDRYFIIIYSNAASNFYSTKNGDVKLLYSNWRNSILLNDSTLISGSWENGVFLINPSQKYMGTENHKSYFAVGGTFLSNRINGMLKDTKERVWIASDRGISLFYNNEVKVIGQDKLNKQFIEVKEDKNGFIWALNEKGLSVFKDTSIVYEFLKDEHKNVKSFEFDNSSRVWLSTQDGLLGASVRYDNKSLTIKKEYLLNENAGLVSNDINSIYFDNIGNQLWIGTSNGLSSVDLNDFAKLIVNPLPLKILSISTSDSVYNFDKTVIFPSNTKEVIITATSFDVNSTGNLFYVYKLNDEDTAWYRSEGNIIKFASLSHGDYNLQIRAENNFGKLSEVSVINFTIETPFERSYFFYFLIALSGMGIAGLVIYRSLKKKYIIESERNAFKNHISELKQKSLVSMMNPHFVFNSLNSIQSFYNYKENEAANEYLAKFSRLIRMNLDLADKTFIKLSDELERLENYILLEKMRFDDRLNYEIWVSDDINPQKTEIPNMVIQPFVENAIWHGILKSKNDGFITINIFHSEMPIEIKQDYKIQYHASLNKDADKLTTNYPYCLKIEITDNGIGYNEALKRRQSNHISRGVSVIKERLSILHHYSGEAELVKITDRSELTQSETGTFVEIFLTPNIYKTT